MTEENETTTTTVISTSSFDPTTLNETTRIFLQSPAAQGISGLFTWLALIITGHQVNK